MPAVDRQEGRHAFGSDPAGYDFARPEYPERMYQILEQRCGLGPGARTLEIGPGPGNVTRHLMRLGAGPLVLVEPDERFAGHLAHAFAGSGIKIASTTFDRARLFTGWFDLAVAATSFHWLEERAALRKIARALRPGGWWAAWWNVYSDPSRPDEFFEATEHLFAGMIDPDNHTVPGRLSFALDTEARLNSLRAVGRFDHIECDPIAWTLTFTTAQTVDLYATFPTILRLPRRERERLLEQLAGISEDRFGGRVERPMLTPLYTARKSGTEGGG